MNFKDYIQNHLKEHRETLHNIKPSNQKKFEIFVEREDQRREMMNSSDSDTGLLLENLEDFDQETLDSVFKSPKLIKKSIFVQETKTVKIGKVRNYLS